MSDIWGFLLQTLTASGAAVLLLVIKALFRDKLPPKWHFAVWGVLGFVLLLPAGVNGRYTLFNWQMVVELIKSWFGDYEFSRVFFPIPFLNRVPQTITEWIFAIYVLGVVIHIIKYLISYIRLRMVLRNGNEVSAEVLSHIQQIADAQKVKPCRMIEVSGLPSAFVCGIIKPILVLTADKEIDDKVILHELLHLKYKDTVWSVVICLFRCIHWCNPFLIYCANQATNDMEARCDQHVLEQLEGEERRDYGRILLSMANERFAKTPGTTCVNNGGKNISNRIEAIARFKKYPAGMGLVSVCVIILLALSLVIGVQATEVYDETNNYSVHLSIASARSTPCTTPAGAFDTYGKALLEQNGIYRIMCAPENMQAELADEIIEKNKTGIYPEWDTRLQSWADTQSGYYIYNLEVSENNTYEGLIVVRLNYPPDGQAEEEGKMYLAFQKLRVEKEKGRWVAVPLEKFQTVKADEESLEWGCKELPSITYTGTAADFKVDLLFQTVHIVDNKIQSNDAFSSMFGSSYTYYTVPKPNAEFTDFYESNNTNCTHLGTQEERDSILQIGISVAAVQAGEEKPEKLTAATGGSASGSNSQGESWSSADTRKGWGPEIWLSGGGSGGSYSAYMTFDFPEYYAADLYVNNNLLAEMELHLEKEVAE